jgi:hypothetical protein
MESMAYRIDVGVSDVSDVYLTYFKINKSKIIYLE